MPFNNSFPCYTARFVLYCTLLLCFYTLIILLFSTLCLCTAQSHPARNSMGKCVSKQSANSNWETGSADFAAAVSERSFALLIGGDEVNTKKKYISNYKPFIENRNEFVETLMGKIQSTFHIYA